MALEFVVDTIDSIPEASRKFYTEKEGKFHLDDVLAENIRGLKSALETKTQIANSRSAQLKELESKYSGIDPEKTRQLMSKFENDAEAQLIAAGKIDEVIQTRTEKWRAEEERKNTDLQAKLAAAEAKAESFKGSVLDDSFRAAAAEIGDMHPADDMLLGYLRGMFTLDNNGKPVQIDDNGDIILGKDGKTPYSPKEHLDGLRTTKPWLFKISSSGSPASGSAGSSSRQMKRAVFDSLSALEKSSTIKNGTKIVD